MVTAVSVPRVNITRASSFVSSFLPSSWNYKILLVPAVMELTVPIFLVSVHFWGNSFPVCLLSWKPQGFG